MKCPIHIVTVEGTGIESLSYSFRSAAQAKYWFHKEKARLQAEHKHTISHLGVLNFPWQVSASDTHWLLSNTQDGTFFQVNWIETSIETTSPEPERMDELIGELVYHIYESCGGDPEDTKITLQEGIGFNDYELYYYASDLIEEEPDEPEPDDEDDDIDKEVK